LQFATDDERNDEQSANDAGNSQFLEFSSQTYDICQEMMGMAQNPMVNEV